jgi:ABC-type uncharacterized transport system substrate-binding protein
LLFISFKKKVLISLCLFVSCSFFCVSSVFAAERFKVLVVFSYEENAPWDIEIREEIEKVLGPFAELSFFYMDTKVALEGGSAKASEAFSLYQQIQPDGVIAVDDNAQSMFVVPYLKNRETIPIMFCGVNGKPELYGYPTENISGILERFHLEESISLSKQLAGNIENFAFMVKEGPVAGLISEQLEAEKHQLSAKMVKFLTPKTMEEAVEMAENARDDVDLLFLVALWGMIDSDGKKVEEEDAIPPLVAAFGKPTAAIGASVVREGALCAVITNAREHGARVANMLLQAMRGVPIAQLPIVCNCYGRRMVNVSSLRQLGLTPEPIVLRGVELVCNKNE